MADELEDIQAQLRAAPDGAVKVRLYEEAIRLADSRQDERRAAKLRGELVTESIGAGLPDRALVAYAWLRNYERRKDPDAALSSHMLWKLKWLAEELPLFIGVSQEQIDEFFADMKREYERSGSSLRPYYQQRMMAAMALGRPPEEVSEHYAQWQSGLRDGGADCAACERNSMVEVHLHHGDLDLALEVAEPLIRELFSCWQVPHRTIGCLLMPLYDAGRLDLAWQLHEQYYDCSRGRGDLIGAVGSHLELCVLGDRVHRGRTGVEQHLAMALDNAAELRRLPFLLGAHAVLQRLAEPGKPVVLDIPLVQLTSTESSTAVMTDVLREALLTGLASLESDGVASFDAGVLVDGLIAEIHHIVESADARGDQRFYAAALDRYRARHG